jgi:hypothetical protein
MSVNFPSGPKLNTAVLAWTLAPPANNPTMGMKVAAFGDARSPL